MPSVTHRSFGLVPVAVGALLIALAGCGDEAESPTAPAPTPAAGLEAATAALVSFTQVSAGGSNPMTPARVAGGLSFRSVIAGGGFTCGVTTSNKGYCWGYNGDGGLGDGTRTNRNKPVAVAGGLSFRSVVAGGGRIEDEQQ